MSGTPRLRARHVFAAAVGTIIGAGWIISVGPWVETAGSLGAVAAFLAGGLLVLPVALCYAELAALLPEEGGEIAFASAAFGQRSAVFVGWMIILTLLAVLAFVTSAFGQLMTGLLPLPGSAGFELLQANGRQIAELLTDLIAMIFLVCVNLRGARAFGALQLSATCGLLGLSMVFIVAGAAWGEWSNLSPYVIPSPDGSPVGGILAVLLTTLFWYSGFNSSAQAMSSVDRTAVRRAGIAIVIAILVATFFYCAVILSVCMIVPREQFLGSELPAIVAFDRAFESPWAGRLILLCGALGLITTWNAVLFAASRVVIATSKQIGLAARMPGLAAFAESPRATLWGCASLGLLGPLLGRQMDGISVNTAAMCCAIVYLAVALAAMRLRVTRASCERPFRAPGGKLTMGIAAAVAAAMLALAALGAITDSSPHALIGPASILAWAAAGLVMAASVRRRITTSST